MWKVCVWGASVISTTTVNRKEDTACFQNALLVHRWLMNQWMMVNDFILFSHLIGRMPNYKATRVHFVVWLDCSWWTSAENKVRRDQTWVSAWSGINASLIHTSLGRWLSSVRRPDWKSCGVMLGWQLSSSSLHVTLACPYPFTHPLQLFWSPRCSKNTNPEPPRKAFFPALGQVPSFRSVSGTSKQPSLDVLYEMASIPISHTPGQDVSPQLSTRLTQAKPGAKNGVCLGILCHPVVAPYLLRWEGLQDGNLHVWEWGLRWGNVEVF